MITTLIKRFKEDAVIYLICIVLISLFFPGCVVTDKKQTSLKDMPQNNKTDNDQKLASEKDESKNDDISDDQIIECRKIVFTGSRFKKKVCKTKAQWAWEDSGGKSDVAEKLQKDADRSFSKSVSNAANSGSFPGASVPR